MGFREDFIAWRRASGYSQEEAARLLNVSAGTISKWERGIHLPDSDRVVGALDEVGINYERPVIDRLDERMRRAEDRIDTLLHKVRVLEVELYGEERRGEPAENMSETPPVIPTAKTDLLAREVEELRRRVDALGGNAPPEGGLPSDEDQPQSGQAG